jgi:hypothetical protein
VNLTQGERAALNRHVAEIRKILKAPSIAAAMQMRLNVNEHVVQSVEYKFLERIQVEAIGR